MSKPDASTRKAPPDAAQQAAAIEQVLMAQAEMQSMLLNAFEWSFKACTTASSGPQLSSKEKRCVQQGVASYVDARSHLAQSMLAQAQASNER